MLVMLNFTVNRKKRVQSEIENKSKVKIQLTEYTHRLKLRHIFNAMFIQIF